MIKSDANRTMQQLKETTQYAEEAKTYSSAALKESARANTAADDSTQSKQRAAQQEPEAKAEADKAYTNELQAKDSREEARIYGERLFTDYEDSKKLLSQTTESSSRSELAAQEAEQAANSAEYWKEVALDKRRSKYMYGGDS